MNLKEPFGFLFFSAIHSSLMTGFNTADKLIMAAARLNPTENELLAYHELAALVTDWDYFVGIAIHSGTASLLHRNLSLIKDLNIIPKKVKLALQQIYFKTLSRNINIYEHFREIVPALSAQNIHVIALKGIFLAENLYKDIGLRHLSDIDLLVRSEEIEKAGNILISCGYSPVDASDKRDFSKKKDYGFTKGEVFVELHQNIHPPYESFSVNISEYWDRAQKTIIDGQDILVLSLEDMLQHLCIHLFIHISNGKFSFINFCDIAGLLKTQAMQPDWSLLEKNNKKYNCSDEVGAILALAAKYLDVAIPEHFTVNNIFIHDGSFDERFINIFQGVEVKWGTDDYKMHNLRKTRGLRTKTCYLLQELFPLKSFMLRRYHPRFAALYFLYYPYRFFSLGIKAFMFLIKKK
jgi:hypothetical protein